MLVFAMAQAITVEQPEMATVAVAISASDGSSIPRLTSLGDDLEDVPARDVDDVKLAAGIFA
jgi:hypothetical protein